MIQEAQRVIESLRKGIPPDGYVRCFTVGRESEIKVLTGRLGEANPGALLLKANYGSGKTHLLRFIREQALECGFAVSMVTLDSKGGARFNRLDQILGAVCRNIEIPDLKGSKGVRHFLNRITLKIEENKAGMDDRNYWYQLTNQWRWDYSDVLESPALFVAIRAWATGHSDITNFVEDWLFQPWKYQRKELYDKLIISLRRYFRDPRGMYQFYSDGVFSFNTQGYTQSWQALRDLNRLAQEANMRGLIILFDEFEDILTNLGRIDYKEAALWNLFQFSTGNLFPCFSFYAVTPEFIEKCIRMLVDKNRWDYDFSRFESLPTFEMSPLSVSELTELAVRISQTHGTAYSWEPATHMNPAELYRLVKKAASMQIQDRARQTIVSVVKFLDNVLQESE